MVQSDTPFFLSNRTKTCTIRRLIKEIQHLAGNLGTELEMLFKETIYYLLYGSEIFSEFLLIQEVTVLLKKNKKTLINVLKLILKVLL